MNVSVSILDNVPVEELAKLLDGGIEQLKKFAGNYVLIENNEVSAFDKSYSRLFNLVNVSNSEKLVVYHIPSKERLSS